MHENVKQQLPLRTCANLLAKITFLLISHLVYIPRITSLFFLFSHFLPISNIYERKYFHFSFLFFSVLSIPTKQSVIKRRRVVDYLIPPMIIWLGSVDLGNINYPTNFGVNKDEHNFHFDLYNKFNTPFLPHQII